MYPLTVQQSSAERRVYFGPSQGWLNTPVVDRGGLNGSSGSGPLISGPLIIEEYDSTTVVPPGWRASVDHWRNIILER